jgi:hypothetical protein
MFKGKFQGVRVATVQWYPKGQVSRFQSFKASTFTVVAGVDALSVIVRTRPCGQGWQGSTYRTQTGIRSGDFECNRDIASTMPRPCTSLCTLAMGAGAQGWVRHHPHAVELLRFSATEPFIHISCNIQGPFIARTLQDVRHKFCHRAFRAVRGKATGCFSPLRRAVPAR